MEIPHRQIRVNLKNYPYRKDIENRLQLAQMSVFEVNILQEILNDSLKVSIASLAQTLHVDVSLLIQALKKLSTTQLFKQEGPHLLVDKEMRKYYEFQMGKFEEDFIPGMEFLQGLLSKVPIHVLPLWYDILGHSNNIFNSIVEKYLINPKVYRHHLNHLIFDEPIVHYIMRDVYQSPNFKIPSSNLIDKYGLTREKFEEYLLLLEYHFACCISYCKVGDQWQEIVTPFAEWLEYLQFEKMTKPQIITNLAEIKQKSPAIEFGFIRDIQTVLRVCSSQPGSVDNLKKRLNQTDEYVDHLLSKLAQLKFISFQDSLVHLCEKGNLWLNMPAAELSAFLSTHPTNVLTPFSNSSLHTVRHFRQIEKSLKNLNVKEWVYLDDFLKGFVAPLGDKESVILKNKGKKWRYVIPTYTDEEKEFIKAVIFERLFELGIVAAGTHQEKPCFCLTSFGRGSFN